METWRQHVHYNTVEKQRSTLFPTEWFSVWFCLSVSCKQNALCLLCGRTVLPTEALQEKPSGLFLVKKKKEAKKQAESEIVHSISSINFQILTEAFV